MVNIATTWLWTCNWTLLLESSNITLITCYQNNLFSLVMLYAKKCARACCVYVWLPSCYSLLIYLNLIFLYIGHFSSFHIPFILLFFNMLPPYFLSVPFFIFLATPEHDTCRLCNISTRYRKRQHVACVSLTHRRQFWIWNQVCPLLPIRRSYMTLHQLQSHSNVKKTLYSE